MKQYKIKFKGVQNGSIGSKRTFMLTIDANNLKEANLKLYDTHEHIFILSVNGKPYSYKYDAQNEL